MNHMITNTSSAWPPTPTIAVGSENPSKVGAARTVFTQLAPQARILAVDVPSGVPAQPIGWTQTKRGALTRAHAARSARDTDYGVGMEGGVRFDPDDPDTAWLIGVAAVATAAHVWWATAGSLLLPPAVARRVAAGEELGPVIDDITGLADAKTSLGAVGWLTGGLLWREHSWVDTLARTVAPLVHPEWYRRD